MLVIVSMCICKPIHSRFIDSNLFFSSFFFSFSFASCAYASCEHKASVSLCVADNKIIEQKGCMNRWRTEKDVEEKKNKVVYHTHHVHHTCEQAIVEDRAITLSIETGGQLS